MSTTTTSTTTTCSSCGATLSRVRFYPRQLINADDLVTEQEYHRQRARRHNRMAHGWGVTCGADVKPDPTPDLPWQIVVCPGFIVDPRGDEIHVLESVRFDLATGVATEADPCADAWPCPPTGNVDVDDDARAYLVIRYAECHTRPERVHPIGCGCNEAACEYSRIQDGYELTLLWELPQSHVDAAAADSAWKQKVATWRDDSALGDPVPECPVCPEEPWVVLATIALPSDASTEITETNIHYGDRRVLLSTWALQVLAGAP